MRSQNEIWYNTFAIVSEPGDAPRYEYMVYRDGPEDFCFMPMSSTFRFPQRLNYYSVKDMHTNRIDFEQEGPIKISMLELAEKEKCNIHTLMECINTVKLLHERSMK